jgi:hypothetical protein
MPPKSDQPNWERMILFAILGLGGGGEIFNGVGQSKVVDQLVELKAAVVEVAQEFKTQREDYRQFKDETMLRLKDLELTMRKQQFNGR